MAPTDSLVKMNLILSPTRTTPKFLTSMSEVLKTNIDPDDPEPTVGGQSVRGTDPSRA